MDENTIAWLRQCARSSDDTADELRATADAKEARKFGHECGHQFAISFASIGHSWGVVGEEPQVHSDADWSGEPHSVVVRARDLHEALRKAASLPLSAWSTESPDGWSD